jgi:gas vesicle protein
MTDQLPEIENALDEAVDAISDAADTVVEEVQEATREGESGAKFTLEMVGDSLRGVEATLKQLADDISALKAVPKEVAEPEKTIEDAADFVVPDIDEAPRDERPKGVRRRRKARRGR